MDKFIPQKEALKTLHVHYHTLVAMGERQEIDTIRVGRKIFYNLDKYLRDQGVKPKKNIRKICYCRVSSSKQKEDLERQIEQMTEAYPKYELITDVGSGLNFKRKGLQKIIDYGIRGEIEEVVIAYKDRLARIGFEMIEMIINNYSNGKITILNKDEEETPEEEITKDIISIMNIYVAKINGLRKYKTKIKKYMKEK